MNRKLLLKVEFRRPTQHSVSFRVLSQDVPSLLGRSFPTILPEKNVKIRIESDMHPDIEIFTDEIDIWLRGDMAACDNDICERKLPEKYGLFRRFIMAYIRPAFETMAKETGTTLRVTWKSWKRVQLSLMLEK